MLIQPGDHFIRDICNSNAGCNSCFSHFLIQSKWSPQTHCIWTDYNRQLDCVLESGCWQEQRGNQSAFVIDSGPTLRQNKLPSLLISCSLYLMKYACSFWLADMKYWCVVAWTDKKQNSLGHCTSAHRQSTQSGPIKIRLLAQEEVVWHAVMLIETTVITPKVWHRHWYL